MTGKIGGDKSHAKAMHCESGKNTWQTNVGIRVVISKPIAIMRKVVTECEGSIRASISSEGQDKGALANYQAQQVLSWSMSNLKVIFFHIDMHHLANFACLGEIEVCHFKLA